MKTSNKLLLGFLAVILITTTALIGTVKYYSHTMNIVQSGEIVTESRPVTAFTKLKAEKGIHVFLTANASPALELKGDKNLLKNIETTVEDGELYIKIPFNTDSHPVLEAYVSMDSVEALDFSTGSSLDCNGVIKSGKLQLTFSTGATCKIEIASAETSLHCSTGAVIELNGSTESFQLHSSTGAVVNASDFVAHNGIIEGNTGSVMNINVTGEIDAILSTAAIVKCMGNPVNKSINITTGAVFNKI
jgi:hypothetical protein